MRDEAKERLQCRRLGRGAYIRDTLILDSLLFVFQI